MTRKCFGTVTALLLACLPAFAQQTTGNITGRITDQQRAPVPGASVTATNPQTGFKRTDISDGQGIYRLNALPVGSYDVSAELPGFTTIEREAIAVDVSETRTIDVKLQVAGVTETVSISGSAPTDKTDSSVGGVVDLRRVEGLPLNGRQFANLAATLPGVGIGFSIDPTKSTNYAPQINGGAGRNVNYVVDGGDNNDDTVGGLAQQFPLEAIQEFNFITQRFKAEYGRSNGGVMNVVTKSGTNQWSGSFFELFRDTAMNAETETEHLADNAGAAAGKTPAGKNPYRRNQYGGSFGGPIERDKAQFYVALERTQQDKSQTVNTGTLFPNANGPFPVQYRENIGTGRVVLNVNPRQYVSIRYSGNNNSYPVGAGPTTTADSWADATNMFHSFNVNHNWVAGGAMLNEFVFQYADYANDVASRTNAPNETYPGGIQMGANLNAPQATEQRKFQFRDDLSWHVTGRAGLGHDFKAGINFVNEPRLFINIAVANNVVQYTHLTGAPNGPIQTVLLKQGYPAGSAAATSDLPNKQYGLYVQDDWRVSERMTLNLGVRYDLVTGLAIDQSQNPNFVKIHAAAQAGALTGIAGLENFGLSPQSDRNNVQPRLGAVYDLKGDGRDIIRGGWGIYTDFGYTASNIAQAAIDAGGTRFGTSFSATDNAGLKNPDGTLYQVGQPLTNLSSQNQVVAGSQPMQGFWADPRLQEPYQIQSNVGWSHELTENTVVGVDYVNSLGRDLNFKPRVNQLIPGTTTRRVSVLLSSPLSPNTSSDRPVISQGRSQYNALTVSARRRFSRGFDFLTSYTLSRGLSNIGNASDETNTANIQDPNNPFDAPVQFGPNLFTDARHRVNVSAIVELPHAIRLAPFFLYRSALPVNLIDGRDLNKDGDAFDIPATAYAVDSVNRATGVATIKELGPCQTVNCGRASPQSQLNLRVSRVFRVSGRLNVEAIGEVYNLFNALNPATANRTVTVPTTGLPNPALLQPQTYSGDDSRPEQRLGQIGFRVTF